MCIIVEANNIGMGTLSSFRFGLISPNGCNFREKIQSSSTKCFLCRSFSSKKRRQLVSKRDFGRLNSVIRSCYNGKDDTEDDRNSTGDRESKENSNLATMMSAENKPDDIADDTPASTSSRVSIFFGIHFMLFYLVPYSFRKLQRLKHFS